VISPVNLILDFPFLCASAAGEARQRENVCKEIENKRSYPLRKKKSCCFAFSLSFLLHKKPFQLTLHNNNCVTAAFQLKSNFNEN